MKYGVRVVWILAIAFAATVLGRVPIVLVPVPAALQSLLGAAVFLLAAALMIDCDVVRENLRTTALQVSGAAVAAWCLLHAFNLYDRSLPFSMYAGIGLGAASEEVVFRGWLPTTLRRWFGNRRRRAEAVAVLVSALSFSLSHLLVQQHYSPARTSRLVLLLFVAAILYSEIVRVAGIGLAVLVHALLNAMAFETGAVAHRPGWYVVAAMLLGAGAIGNATFAPRPTAARTIIAGGSYCAAVAATLAVITGNTEFALLTALIALCWATAAQLVSRAASPPGLPSAPSHAPGTAPPAGRR
jgi:membrane protease YdiL (CAAX protease family)